MATLSMFTFLYSISLLPLAIFKFQEIPGERWNLKSPSTSSKRNYCFWVFTVGACDPPLQNTEGSNVVHVLGSLSQLLKRPLQARRHHSIRLHPFSSFHFIPLFYFQMTPGTVQWVICVWLIFEYSINSYLHNFDKLWISAITHALLQKEASLTNLTVSLISENI